MALNITIGQMRTKCVLQNSTPVADGSGGYTDVYADVVTFFARMRQKSSRRAAEQDELVQNQDYEIVTRAQDAIVINTTSRLIIDGQAYLVNKWQQVDEIKHWFVFTVSIFK